MLDAFCRVRRRKMARLVILGDGELREELENMARSEGVGDDVAFLGFVPHPSAYMKRCSVFVLSSRFEGLPTVLVEAMASGAPVVSTDCPSGPNEIISSGENGVLVPVGDSQALADGILSLLDDERLRDRIRENGFERAQTFSVENAVNRYEELFGSLVKNRKDTGSLDEKEVEHRVAHGEGII